MKKLLIMMLVLCVTSLASATTISLTDEGTQVSAMPGDTVTLTISSDGATALGIISMDTVLTVSGDVITGAMNLTDCASYGWDPGFSDNPKFLGTTSVAVAGGSSNFTTGNIAAIVGYVEVAYTGGIQVVSIAAGMNWGGSYLLDGSSPVYSQGIVEIVPEPMTIALLGLGGLFMLRRRK